MSQAIGIDLGTTFSAISIVDKSERPKIINNQHGKPLTPSVIYFGEGNPVVGDEAKEMQGLGEDNVASFFKRSMGNSDFILSFNNQRYNATDLSAILLRSLKKDAELSLGFPVKDVVITVPAYFNNFQREATIEAGQKAGLNVLRIINEPTAAAIAFGMNKHVSNQHILVYDLGGGTFDITLVKITQKNIVVIATDGDHELGGKDWDDRIATYLSEKFYEDHHINPLDDTISFNDLLVRCETAKKQLSSRDRARISITHEGERERYELTREQFEEITSDLLARTQNLTEDVLQKSGFKWKKIDGVLLIGGSTRMPMVKDYVEKMSGKPAITGINVDEAVALGAAIQAQMDSNTNLFTLGAKQTQDVMSHSLGMVAENEDRSKYINSIIIPKNKPIPCSESKPYQLRTATTRKNELEVYMLQGESDTPLSCVVLGKYIFSEISHVHGAPAMINVAYSYDKNGVVIVKAVEESTKKELPMTKEPPANDMSWLGQPPEDEIVELTISVMLTIDVSGSMSGGGLNEAKKAALAFVDKSDLSNTTIGLVAFGSSAELICPLTNNENEIKSKINSLSITGSTNMTDGIITAHQELEDLEDPRFIVLLTDGYPNCASSTRKAAKNVCAEGIDLITIGTGEADKSFLKEIACSDENSFFAQSGQVVGTFSKIAQVIGETRGGYSHTGSQRTTKSGFLKIFG